MGKEWILESRLTHLCKEGSLASESFDSDGSNRMHEGLARPRKVAIKIPSKANDRCNIENKECIAKPNEFVSANGFIRGE